MAVLESDVGEYPEDEPVDEPEESSPSERGSRAARILVVDDDDSLREALCELLANDGFEATAAASAEEAMERLRLSTFHLVLCDLQLPGRNGLSLIKAIREACPATACVLVTGHGSVRTAVTALKRGAAEYVAKPVKARRLLSLCRALTADLPDFLPNRLLIDGQAGVVRLGGMVARSRPMQSVFERVALAAQSETPVLILGERGVGKEMVARTIHGCMRARAGDAGGPGPFVTLETSALPPAIVTAELFGQERPRGASDRNAPPPVPLLERAANGTLYIDELCALDAEAQAHLVRLLSTSRWARPGGRRERQAHVRVIAGSTRREAERRDRVRRDLLERLSVFTIDVPPLREREGDVAVLADELLRELAARHAKEVAVLPPATQRLLAAHSFPGNVRELRAVLEQAVLLAHGGAIEPSLLPPALRQEPVRPASIQIPIGTPISAIEREVILRTLEALAGNKTAAAEALGISRRSIYNKLAEYGIKAEPDSTPG